VLIDSNPIIGAIADINGRYALQSLPIGRHSFKVSYIGYEDVYLNEIQVESGKEVIINVAMKEAISELETIVIVTRNVKDFKKSEIAVLTPESFLKLTKV